MAGLWLGPEDTVDPNGIFTDSAIRTASWLLFKLTAEKYTGLTESTEVYELHESGMLEYSPQVISGKMYNLPKGTLTNSNSIISLRQKPVHSILSVVADGRVVPFSEYQIIDYSSLQRRDKLPWLVGGMNELLVTYEHGSPPPAAGRRAAIRLANEFIWAESDPERCSLPERVTSVQRQGISYTIMDPQSFIDEGKTGIYEIDLFIKAANPLNAKKKPRIYSAGRPSGESRVR